MEDFKVDMQGCSARSSIMGGLLLILSNQEDSTFMRTSVLEVTSTTDSNIHQDDMKILRP